MTSPFTRMPATHRLYQQLKDWIMSVPAGERLGTLDEIIERYRASKPTFRQAASLLESEQMLEIRRGNGGGYYASRPTARAATSVTANYCRSLKIPRNEIIAAWMPIRLETVRLAARDKGAKALPELQEFMAELRRGNDRQFAMTVRRFNALLGLLADNRMLSLFYEILHESGHKIDHLDFYRRRPDRIAAYRAQMLIMGKAIMDGNEERAYLASRTCIELNVQWMKEDGLRDQGRSS